MTHPNYLFRTSPLISPAQRLPRFRMKLLLARVIASNYQAPFGVGILHSVSDPQTKRGHFEFSKEERTTSFCHGQHATERSAMGDCTVRQPCHSHIVGTAKSHNAVARNSTQNRRLPNPPGGQHLEQTHKHSPGAQTVGAIRLFHWNDAGFARRLRPLTLRYSFYHRAGQDPAQSDSKLRLRQRERSRSVPAA